MDTVPNTTPLQPAQNALLSASTAWTLLGLWLCLAGPLFVCMPLNSDTALFDVQVRRVLNGGIAYRDIVEPNLPGVLWIHMAVRSLVGWSSEAIRLFDLCILIGSMWAWSKAVRMSPTTRSCLFLFAAFFYMTRNEWCHAQRDLWMLLPVGTAVWLRLRSSSQERLLDPLLEGICWGAAFWIKPHVAIPALAVILADVWICRRSRTTVVREVGLVITGGLLAAVPGIAWLMVSGTWDPFWNMMLEWNPEYVAAGRSRMSLLRWELMIQRFAPWPWLHLVAVPVAIASVAQGVRSRRSNLRSRMTSAVCYLAWLLQTICLQHALDYIHVPAILLGLVVLVTHPWRLPTNVRRSIVAAFMLLGVLSTPAFTPHRISYWVTAIRSGSTCSVRAALAHGNMPQWEQLGQVIGHLRALNAKDGDVTCLNVHSVHVFNELQIHPSTRYWSVNMLQELFPGRAADIAQSIANSGHRYVVVDEFESRLLSAPSGQEWLSDMEPIWSTGRYQILAALPEHDKATRAIGQSDRRLPVSL